MQLQAGSGNKAPGNWNESWLLMRPHVIDAVSGPCTKVKAICREVAGVGVSPLRGGRIGQPSEDERGIFLRDFLHDEIAAELWCCSRGELGGGHHFLHLVPDIRQALVAADPAWFYSFA